MWRNRPSVLFFGDLDDPWVATIASALPRDAARISCADLLPDPWPDAAQTANAIVLHRPFPTLKDAERIHRLRVREGSPPRLVLCVGPSARYASIEPFAQLVDAILPEATASETIARHVQTPPSTPRRPSKTTSRPRVAIVSRNVELRLMLADACHQAGFPAQPVRDWIDAPSHTLTVWDVPVLENGWDEILARESITRTILSLIGFADRSLVATARARGASACLDLPVDPADLVFVLERLASIPRRPPSLDAPHTVPPPPVGLPRAQRPRSVHPPPSLVKPPLAEQELDV